MNVGEIGLLGEWQAARFLRRHGMRILAKRYRALHGEIDLIARDGDTLVFAEVKYRPKGAMGEGILAVNREKTEHIRRAASVYLQSHPCDSIRFDVIEISAAGLRHIKNAF